MRMDSVASLLVLYLVLVGCMRDSSEPGPEPEFTGDRWSLFMPGALAKNIATIECALSDGTDTLCYEITVAGTPANHDVGPFCPRTTSATEAEVGKWLDGTHIYDLTGQFILDLPTIYQDDHWMLHDGAGQVRVTETREAFEAAARPDVAEEYENYCVEGRMEWLEGGEPVTTTVQIPATPVPQNSSIPARAPLGVTFNGVRIDAAAPVDAILGAYTIAAFDDCGGHVNPFEGYHMHATTGCGEVGDAPDGDTPPFGVAMDGYLIHSSLKGGDLDTCNGHTTDEYGYHYHARSPELNGVLTCYMGATVGDSTGGPPGRGRPDGAPPIGGEGFEAPVPHDHN